MASQSARQTDRRVGSTGARARKQTEEAARMTDTRTTILRCPQSNGKAKPMPMDQKLQDQIADFWQMVMDTGYMMEGERRGYEREKMKMLADGLGCWIKAHPEIKEDGPLEHFAMFAVWRLAAAFAFNDLCGADLPDFKQRLLDVLLEPSQETAEQLLALTQAPLQQKTKKDAS
jgi:hypothetical protein